MAQIYPFKALRYTKKAGKLKDNICPPYDIISADERKALINKSVFNLVTLEKPEGENKYVEARHTLEEWIKNGVVAYDDSDSVYLYRVSFVYGGADYHYDGIIALCKAYNFDEKVVLPHENTLSGAKEDRFRLLLATRTSFSSVYSLYEDKDGAVKNGLEGVTETEPVSKVTDGEGVTHTLWRISDTDRIDAIVNAMADKKLYIADGHHRYETALRYRDFTGYPEAGCLLMTMVDMDSEGLLVLPTHRIFKKECDVEAAIKAMDEDFEISVAKDKAEMEAYLEANKDKHVFGIYSGGVYRTATLKWAVDFNSPVKDLDVSVLHDVILEKQFGVTKEDLASQTCLEYTRDTDEAVAAVDSGKAAAAFILNPTKVSQIRDVADAGEKMPQKSTYFHPKLISGLIMRRLF